MVRHVVFRSELIEGLVRRLSYLLMGYLKSPNDQILEVNVFIY